MNAIVAAAENVEYDLSVIRRAVHHTLDQLETPLSAIVRPGDAVLVKVNMGCSGSRAPENRLTTHPLVAQAVIEALLDCRGKVSFGDDVARAGRHTQRIYDGTGMSEVAKRTGAVLVDFVGCGAREVGSRLLYPRTYLVTNAYFEADVVINAANCRSGPAIVGMSGAIKNMFGCVIGKRKQHIHNLFGADPRKFGKAIADVHRAIPADLSFLDLTTVADGFGISPSIRAVGLLLASVDPVALDTVAAHAIGYEGLPRWASVYGSRFRLGCDDINRICVRGMHWETRLKARLSPPLPVGPLKEDGVQKVTRVLNNTALRQRPVVNTLACTRCGECAQRCPVRCISRAADGVYQIDHANCALCFCCLKVCESGAIALQFVGATRFIRSLLGRV